MNYQQMKQVILDQAEGRSFNYVRREILDKIDMLHDNPFIIVITGIRRCGKSSVLEMIRCQADERDFFVSFDDDRFATFALDDFQRLLECFIELYGPQKSIYLDEIQLIEGWERFIRRLHDAGYKIYLTGSNATLFSKELGTRLTGRYIDVEMYPFSFREFLLNREPTLLKEALNTQETAKIKQHFSSYHQEGGLPEYLQYHLAEYLHTLYENILYKDIITRYKLSSERIIKQLAYYLASHVAKDTSYNKLAQMLSSSASTISDYCQYLEMSYLFFPINRFSASLKKQQGYHKKNYCIDTALARTIGFRMSDDEGRMLENIVFLELKRQHQEIYFHREKYECDFIIKQNHCIIKAIQVTLHLDNPDTKKREIAGLTEAMQSYHLQEGWILTEDETEELTLSIDEKTYLIHILPVWRWLLTACFF